MNHFFLLIALSGMTAIDLADDELFQPEPIVQCLKNPQTSSLSILTDMNPFYLRGDFDADGRPDYALTARSQTGGTGVLICMGSGALFLLGSGLGTGTFSDMDEDRFTAPQWTVYTKQDVAELGEFQSNVPVPVPSVTGESIAMIWEDGISLIYWDGMKFMWAGSKE